MMWSRLGLQGQRDAALLMLGAAGGAVMATAFALLLPARKQQQQQQQPGNQVAPPAEAAPECITNAEADKAAFKMMLQGQLRGAMVVAMIYLGDKLGLYKAMAVRGEGRVATTWTASSLAKVVGGLHPRLVQEWLNQQAAAGILDFEVNSHTFALKQPGVPCLAQELSGSFFAAYATLALACFSRLPSMLQAFKKSCLAPTYDEAGELVADAMARMHVPEFKLNLIPECFPAILEGQLLERLRKGGLVCADIGCSGADCTLELARAFPGNAFYAYEVAQPALERAHANVKSAGLNSVTVVDAKKQAVGLGPPAEGGAAGGKFDFVLCYDVLHDLSDPEALMHEVRGVLSPHGVWLVVDITAHGDASENIARHPAAGTFYGFSVCLCLPSGLSAEGGKGLGTLGFPAKLGEEMFRSCGFSKVRSFKMPGLEKNTCFEVQI